MITPEKFNKIVNKFPKDKTELAKIELSIASEIDGSISKLEKAVAAEKQWNGAVKTHNSFTKEVIKQVQKAEKERNKLQEAGEKIENNSGELWDEVANLLQKADSAAKELGIKPEGIGAFKKADALSGKLLSVDARGGFYDQNYF